MGSTATQPAEAAQSITCDEALRIAHLDAKKVYRELSGFRIEITEESDGWHIDFELKNPNLNGGGPHYVIDPASGTITAKHYEQ